MVGEKKEKEGESPTFPPSPRSKVSGKEERRRKERAAAPAERQAASSSLPPFLSLPLSSFLLGEISSPSLSLSSSSRAGELR